MTKAAADAVALVDAITLYPKDMDAALREFGASRARYGRAAVAEARRLGAGIGPAVVRGKDAALAARFRTPEIVIREVAPPVA